jgi:hypothetical protein
MRTLFLASLALCLSPAFASAQEDGGTASVVFENDWFGTTDRNYTAGLRASWVSEAREPSGFAGWLGGVVLGDKQGLRVRSGYGLGYSLFTPADTLATEPLPDQHPYAAYAYGEYAALLQREDRLDRLTVQVGLVGPSAGGDWIQNEWHDISGAEPVLGWDNQIGDEATLLVAYDVEAAALSTGEMMGLGFDLRPSFGVTAGNIRTNARAGLTARLGTRLSGAFGPPRVQPSLPGAGFLMPGDGFSWYGFAGVQGRAVAHDIVLDGSFLDDGDPSVDSKTFVADFQAGLVFQYDDLQLAYTYVYRTDTFEGQDKPHEFGAVSLGVRF